MMIKNLLEDLKWYFSDISRLWIAAFKQKFQNIWPLIFSIISYDQKKIRWLSLINQGQIKWYSYIATLFIITNNIASEGEDDLGF